MKKLTTLASMLALYGLTIAVGIATAWRHVIAPQTGTVAPLEFGPLDILIFVGVFALLTLVLLRSARFSSAALGIGLVVVLIAGAQFVFATLVPWYIALLAAVLVVALARLWPLVVLHDVAIVLGIAGVAAVMGLSITPPVACIILALLSIYDIVAVYRTRSMVALAGRMVQSGAVFGFLLPAHLRDLGTRTAVALRERRAMLLGSGDIGLPLVLAASTVSTSIAAAVLVGIASLIGVAVMDYLFTHQEKAMPMAALPPIAALSILGYVLAILLGI